MNFEIINLESVSSTNDYLKQLAKGGAKENTVVIANNQTNGKGTKGRSFVSQNGGVYLSVLVKPKLQGFDATLITSATAVAVSDAINEISGKDAQIKWVNDVYLDNKKVSGILCESVIINGEIAFIIVGIGVNLFKPENDFPPEIKDIATYVLELENPEIKEKFIEILINNFFKYFEDLENKSFLQKYRDKNLVTGREITVISSTGERKGRALLIDPGDEIGPSAQTCRKSQR